MCGMESLEKLPLFMTAHEASEVLRIGRSKTYELVRSGRLKSIRLGKQIRIPKQAIEDFLKSG